MPRTRKQKLNRVDIKEIKTQAIDVGIKIKKEISGFSVGTRILALVLLFALNFSGIMAVRDTVSYFADTEDSSNNVYAAGILDFELSSTADFNPNPVCTSQSSTRTINFLNLANLPKYKVNATSFVGVACDYLDLVAKLDGNVVYTGSLKNFLTNEILFAEPDIWVFDLKMQAGAPSAAQGQNCQFKFVFFGSQERNSLTFGAGFNDIEEITNNVNTCTLESKKVLINKVYYNVAADRGMDPANEWIELYNSASTSMDISDWWICDNNSCDQINVQAIIPAQGFALIAPWADTWYYYSASSSNPYYSIPTGVIKIALMDNIGDGLSSDADMVLLKDNNGNHVDQMNWGNPSVSWPNYNSGVWNLATSTLPYGEALERQPLGYDSDQPSDFISVKMPKINKLLVAPGTWYCGATYTISWDITNYNSSDLLIDIIYIKDSDRNYKLDGSDQRVLVVENVPNTGNYDFLIDLTKGYCFYGYIWIELVAENEENFMLRAERISGHRYEPANKDIFDPTEICADVPAYCGDDPMTCDSIQEFCNDWQASEQIFAAENLIIPEVSLIEVSGAEIESQPAINTQEAILIESIETATTTQESATTTEEISTTTEEIFPVEQSTTTEEIFTIVEDVIETPEEATSTQEIATTTEGDIIEPIEEITEEIIPTETTEPPVIEETPALEEDVVVEPEVVVSENPEPTPELIPEVSSEVPAEI